MRVIEKRRFELLRWAMTILMNRYSPVGGSQKTTASMIPHSTMELISLQRNPVRFFGSATGGTTTVGDSALIRLHPG